MPGQAAPGAGRGVAGGGDQPGVRHQEDGQVPLGEVLAQVTGALGAGDQLGEAVAGPCGKAGPLIPCCPRRAVRAWASGAVPALPPGP